MFKSKRSIQIFLPFRELQSITSVLKNNLNNLARGYTLNKMTVLFGLCGSLNESGTRWPIVNCERQLGDVAFLEWAWFVGGSV